VVVIFHGQLEHNQVRARDFSAMAGPLHSMVCLAVVQEDI